MLKFFFTLLLTAHVMQAMPVPTVVESNLSETAITAIQTCINYEVTESQNNGYEADESEVTEFCTAVLE